MAASTANSLPDLIRVAESRFAMRAVSFNHSGPTFLRENVTVHAFGRGDSDDQLDSIGNIYAASELGSPGDESCNNYGAELELSFARMFQLISGSSQPRLDHERHELHENQAREERSLSVTFARAYVRQSKTFVPFATFVVRSSDGSRARR